MTLRELIGKICHSTKYNNNSNLFKNVETLKDLDTDSDKEEEKNNNTKGKNNNNKLGFMNYSSINQNNSDDDDDDNIYTDNKYSSKNRKANNPNYGAHKIF
jgi:hypothetical protein